jgi:predicted porin
MKKLLIAAAAMSVVAGAQAQSSVQIYGLLDVNAAQVTTTTSSTKTQTMDNTAASYGSVATSHIGLRGSEDLGGGLSATFRFEGTVNPNQGTMGTYNGSTTVTDTMFDRQSTVGLTSATFGSFRYGRTNDAVDDVQNYAGFIKVFDISRGVTAGSTAATTAAATVSGGNGINARNANTSVYQSPVMSGLQLTLTHSAGAGKGINTTTADIDNNTVKTAGVSYKTGNWTVGAASGRATTAWNLEGKTDAAYVGYVVNGIDIRAQRIVSKEVSGTDTFYQYSTNRLGVSAPVSFLGQGVGAVALYQKTTVENASGAVANSDSTIYGLALTKAFSKRTYAYAGYRKTDTDGTGADVKVLVGGLVHAF